MFNFSVLMGTEWSNKAGHWLNACTQDYNPTIYDVGGSMVGQSIVFEAASGDEIRLYNFGGQIYEDSNRYKS